MLVFGSNKTQRMFGRTLYAGTIGQLYSVINEFDKNVWTPYFKTYSAQRIYEPAAKQNIKDTTRFLATLVTTLQSNLEQARSGESGPTAMRDYYSGESSSSNENLEFRVFQNLHDTAKALYYEMDGVKSILTTGTQLVTFANNFFRAATGFSPTVAAAFGKKKVSLSEFADKNPDVPFPEEEMLTIAYQDGGRKARALDEEGEESDEILTYAEAWDQKYAKRIQEIIAPLRAVLPVYSSSTKTKEIAGLNIDKNELERVANEVAEELRDFLAEETKDEDAPFLTIMKDAVYSRYFDYTVAETPVRAIGPEALSNFATTKMFEVSDEFEEYAKRFQRGADNLWTALEEIESLCDKAASASDIKLPKKIIDFSGNTSRWERPERLSKISFRDSGRVRTAATNLFDENIGGDAEAKDEDLDFVNLMGNSHLEEEYLLTPEDTLPARENFNKIHTFTDDLIEAAEELTRFKVKPVRNKCPDRDAVSSILEKYNVIIRSLERLNLHVKGDDINMGIVDEFKDKLNESITRSTAEEQYRQAKLAQKARAQIQQTFQKPLGTLIQHIKSLGTIETQIQERITRADDLMIKLVGEAQTPPKTSPSPSSKNPYMEAYNA